MEATKLSHPADSQVIPVQRLGWVIGLANHRLHSGSLPRMEASVPAMIRSVAAGPSLRPVRSAPEGQGGWRRIERRRHDN